MKNVNLKRVVLGGFFTIGVCVLAFITWQASIKPQMDADWQTPLSKLSTAEFAGDLVTVKNVRNFRYNGSEEEKDLIPGYYDKTYDLSKVSRVWYISSPFEDLSAAAHTFLSFEFSTGDFLSISIEARKVKGQEYSLSKGLIRTYPIMYIAADERDSILVRANIRKAEVYLYPVKTQKGRELLTNILNEMNRLAVEPDWYNTVTNNCTSKIAEHVNNVTQSRIPDRPWQGYVTGYADAFALEHGLLDTNLPIEEARKYYSITKKSQKIGDVLDYSIKIRRFE